MRYRQNFPAGNRTEAPATSLQVPPGCAWVLRGAPREDPATWMEVAEQQLFDLAHGQHPEWGGPAAVIKRAVRAAQERAFLLADPYFSPLGEDEPTGTVEVLIGPTDDAPHGEVLHVSWTSLRFWTATVERVWPAHGDIRTVDAAPTTREAYLGAAIAEARHRCAEFYAVPIDHSMVVGMVERSSNQVRDARPWERRPCTLAWALGGCSRELDLLEEVPAALAAAWRRRCGA